MADVVAYSWDVTKLKKEGIASSSNDAEPIVAKDDAGGKLKHVGIHVFGHFWEFSPNQGIVASKFKDGKEIVSTFKACGQAVVSPLGTTTLAEGDWKEWVDRSVDRFMPMDYDIVKKNSLHWATEAAGALRVQPDVAWREMLEWISGNQEAANREFDAAVNARVDEPIVSAEKATKNGKCVVM